MPPVMSNLARKFDFLQERAERKPIHSASIDCTLSETTKKPGIGHLKEFYLQRLAKTEPHAAARLGGTKPEAASVAVPSQSPTNPNPARPNLAQGAAKDIEDLEVMCNNCFNLIRSSEAVNCTGEPGSCPLACRSGSTDAVAAEKPVGQIAIIDLKLKKLRAALDSRLQDSSSKVNVMRHLTQLRYHIDTAAKWQLGCSEIGALSDHTLQQVRQLTATSRVLAPAVYIFSKRITNVVVQKERELRKAMMNQTSQPQSAGGNDKAVFDIEHTMGADSIADVNSIVSELDSDCGTQYAETVITQDGQTNDVGNVQDANDYLNLKNEDEQRRWFYAQTLTVKLSLSDKTRARKILISDLYAKVREEGVPIDGWVEWIRTQLMPEDSSGTPEAAIANPVTSGPTGGTHVAGGSHAVGGSHLAGGYPAATGVGRPGDPHGSVAAPVYARAGDFDRTVQVPANLPGGAARTQPMHQMQMQTPTMHRPPPQGMGLGVRPAGANVATPMGFPRKM